MLYLDPSTTGERDPNSLGGQPDSIWQRWPCRYNASQLALVASDISGRAVLRAH